MQNQLLKPPGIGTNPTPKATLAEVTKTWVSESSIAGWFHDSPLFDYLLHMVWNPKNSVCVVTGASSGIGRCLCQQLIESGGTVVPVARREQRLNELREISPAQVHPVVGDITDPAVRQKVLEIAASQRDGAVDLLVNNAGIGAIGSFDKANESRMRQIMEVNFFAPVELTRAFIPALRKGNNSVICNISSVLGHRAVPDKSEYCASKFAMHGWSDSLRAELARDSVQVTLVSPSTTSSEFFDSLVGTSADQKSKSFGSWSPARVASAAFSAIKKRRSEVILSLGGKALVYSDRISPPILNCILKKKG